jgi:endonuclease-3
MKIENKNRCKEIIKILCKKNKDWHKKESDPLDILIATILSQNTNDNLSMIAFEALKKRFKDWNQLKSVPRKMIANIIKPAGLSNQKSDTIKNLINFLVKKNGNASLNYLTQMSDDEIFTELKKLKGIGVKTISCLLLFGLKRNSFPVDTHIHRICNRLGLVNTKNANETFFEMKELVPKGKEYSLHVGLIRHGRNTCKASKPECYLCGLVDLCDYEEKNWTKRIKLNTKENIFILDKI